MHFSIFGEDHDITQEQVINVAKASNPESIDGRHKYFVSLEGRRYPIKQLLAGAIDRSNSEFTAQYAQRILKKLGFTVEKFGPPPPRRHFSPRSPSLPNGVFSQEHRNVMQFAVTWEKDEDGFYFSSCPALPGCHSQGRTRDEALNNIALAIGGYLASMRKHGEALPAAQWEVVEVFL